MSMKKEYLMLGLAACALCLLRKRSISGIGRVAKRRIYEEIATLQSRGVDMTCPSWDKLEPNEKKAVVETANQYHYKQPARSTKAYGEAYFNQLRRAYIAISGIGKTDLTPRESQIYNREGDIILIYRDYGTPDQQLRAAYDMVEEFPIGAENGAYWHTLSYIAQGGKIAWKTKRKKDGALIGRGADSIFHGDDSERKARISYIGSEAKGAKNLDQLTHELWEGNGGYDQGIDDSVIYNAVEDVVRSCMSRGQAQKEILDMYLSAHTLPEEDPNAIFDEQYRAEQYSDTPEYIEDDDRPF